MEKCAFGSFWLYFKLPKILKEDEVDVFWGTQHCLPMRNRYTKDMKFVVTIHDLAIEKLKTVGSLKNTIIQKLFLERSIMAADEIIAISEATKKDIVDIFNIDEAGIKVIYNGSKLGDNFELSKEQEKAIEKKFRIKQDVPYVFFLSTIEPRKNVETLIKAFNYIKRKEDIKLKLIIAGGLGWKYEEVLKLYKASDYKDDIIMPGFISKEEKKYLYEHAKCFVYPSLYEGFGLPVLEAMEGRAIVITSNVSSLPEVGGSSAFYFNNVYDYAELGNKILEVISLSEEERKTHVDAGLAQVAKFTWDKCAQATLKVFKQ